MCAVVSDIQHVDRTSWYLMNNHTNVRYKIGIGKLTIGSDRKNLVVCQTRCPPFVSPKHCYIELFPDGTISLTDMSAAGTFIQNIKMHMKTVRLYDDDEIIFAQDDHDTKFTLCRSNYSIDANEIVHVKDDLETTKKCGDVHILPCATRSSEQTVNTDAEDQEKNHQSSDEKDRDENPEETLPQSCIDDKEDVVDLTG